MVFQNHSNHSYCQNINKETKIFKGIGRFMYFSTSLQKLFSVSKLIIYGEKKYLHCKNVFYNVNGPKIIAEDVCLYILLHIYSLLLRITLRCSMYFS